MRRSLRLPPPSAILAAAACWGLASTAEAYELHGWSWAPGDDGPIDSDEVIYVDVDSFDDAVSDVTGASANLDPITALQEAIDIWDAIEPGIRKLTVSTDTPPVDGANNNDGVSILWFGGQAPNDAHWAGGYAYSTDGLVGSCDIQVSEYWTFIFDYTIHWNQALLKDVLVHQIGHCYGIGDNATSGTSMYEHMWSGFTRWADTFDTLEQDDKDALYAIYGYRYDVFPVSGSLWTDVAQPGDTFTPLAEVSFRNAGMHTATYDVDLVLSADGVLDASDTVVSTTTVNAHPGGGSDPTATLDATLPSLADGTYTVFAVLDPDDELREFDHEDDNTRLLGTIHVGPDADGDDVPDWMDECVGNDAVGDADGDGICADLDQSCDTDGHDLGDQTAFLVNGVCTTINVPQLGDCTAVDTLNNPVVHYQWTAPHTARAQFNIINRSSDSGAKGIILGITDGESTCGDVDMCWEDTSHSAPTIDQAIDVVEGVTYDIFVAATDTSNPSCPPVMMVVDGCDNDSDGDGNCDAIDLCWGADRFGDSDGDGWCDDVDQCDFDAPDCDLDDDGCTDDDDDDGVSNCYDACPTESASCDTDGDGCHDDSDGDGVSDCDDVCIALVPTCDLDADGCDDDQDGDGLTDCDDICPLDAAACDPDGDGCTNDRDGDLVSDCDDMCPDAASTCDSDLDGCDEDDDFDGVSDCADDCPMTPATCDADVDGCDDDADGDAVPDCTDMCPADSATCDFDLDGCDDDDDGDLILDCFDSCPAVAAICDVDGDGCDDDADGDTVVDCADSCPTDAATCDIDADGCDDDSDGDGVIDCADTCPSVAATCDVDGDGCDDDADGDAIVDCVDVCPADATTCDLDGDGCDDDADGDGLLDCDDACPTERATCDRDGDGCTDDADGDGVRDCDDHCPHTAYDCDLNADGCMDDEDRDRISDCVDTCSDWDRDGLCAEDGEDPCPRDPDDDADGDGLCADEDACLGDNATGDYDADGVCWDLDTSCDVGQATIDGADGQTWTFVSTAFVPSVGTCPTDGAGTAVSWTAPADGVATFTLDVVGGEGVDPVLGAHAAPARCGDADAICADGVLGSGTETLTFSAVTGTEYVVYTAARDAGSAGIFQLRWSTCSPDTDADLVCDDADACLGDDASGDTDQDGLCDDVDICTGTDALGDGDGDGVCDDLDACVGDDLLGDADADGVCDDLDACTGDDTTGDDDADGVCDDTDLCYGDDALGDVDVDGLCDPWLDVDDVVTGEDTTLTVGGAPPGSRVYVVWSRRGPGSTCHPTLGFCLDVAGPRLIEALTAAPDGTAVTTLAIPLAAPTGRELVFQAVWKVGIFWETTPVETREIVQAP